MAAMAANAAKAQAELDAFGPVSAAQAAASKSLGDSFTLVGDAMMRIAGPVVTALAPVFADIVKALQAMMGGAGGVAEVIGGALAVAFRAIGAVITVIVGGLQQLIALLGGIGEAIVAAFSGDWKLIPDIAKGTLGQIETIGGNVGTSLRALVIPSIQATGEAAKGTTVNLNALPGALNGVGEAGKKAADDLAKLGEKWAGIVTASATGLSPQTERDLTELSKAYQGGALSLANYSKGVDLVLSKDPLLLAEQKQITDSLAAVVKFTDSIADQNNAYADQLAVMGKIGVERDQAIAQQKIQADLTKAIQDAQQKITDPDALAKEIASLTANAAALGKVQMGWIAVVDAEKSYWAIENKQTDANTALETEIKLLGLEGTAREQRLAQLTEEHALALATTQDERDKATATFATTQALLAQKAAWDETKKSIDAWSDVFKSIDDWGAKFFDAMSKGMTGIKAWAKQAGDALKQYLEQVLFELTVKPFVVNIVTQIAGGLGASTSAIAAGAAQSGTGSALGALGSMFSGGSGTSLIGSLASGIGGLAGMFGGTTAAATTAGAVAGMGGGTASLFGAAVEGSSALATEMAATAGTTAALGGAATAATLSLTTMIPVVGAFIAVAYLAYTMLAQQPGGPKSGGYASTGTDDASFARFFTPNDQDASVQKLTDGISAAFTSALAGLGGTGNASFALGFDTDPQGTAGSRVSSAATVGGKTIYQTHDVDVGRDDTAVQAAMQAETERLLLAALQNSDLPPAMAAILNTVAAATASAADVTTVVALAAAFKQVSDIAAAMTDPLKAASDALATANQTTLQNYEQQRQAFMTLASTTPATADGLTALANASADLYKSTVQLVAGMLQLKSSMGAMFADTRENIIRSILPPDQLYERIRQQTQDLFNQLATATDPADINRLTQQINQNIQTEYNALPAGATGGAARPIPARFGCGGCAIAAAHRRGGYASYRPSDGRSKGYYRRTRENTRHHYRRGGRFQERRGRRSEGRQRADQRKRCA